MAQQKLTNRRFLMGRKDRLNLNTYWWPQVDWNRDTTGVNKNVAGMFKKDYGGKPITKFVGLRSKIKAYKVDEEVTK